MCGNTINWIYASFFCVLTSTLFTLVSEMVQVEYLPVVLPEINQKENAVQYAKRVSQFINVFCVCVLVVCWALI